MTAGLNTNLKSQLEQAMATLTSLNGQSYTAQTTGGNAPYVNSIFGLIQNGETMLEGGEEQKVQASVNIIEGILGMISFSQNQTKKANDEVNKNSQNINKNDQTANQKAQEVEQKIADLSSKIESGQANINNAIAEIESLGGERGELAEFKKAVEEQLKEIEAAKKDLNDESKRGNALERIRTAADAINELVPQATTIQEQINAQTAIVDSNTNQIAGLIEQSAAAITEGTVVVQQAIQNSATLGAEAGSIGTQGATDVPTGYAEVKAGEAMNSNIVTALGSGGEGVKLILDGNQRQSAGQTRISGCAKNISSISLSVGKMGGDLTQFANFVTSVGKLGEGVNQVVDSYNNAYIAAVGTFNIDAITEANKEFQESVQNFDKPVDESQNGTQQGGEDKLSTEKLRVAFGL